MTGASPLHPPALGVQACAMCPALHESWASKSLPHAYTAGTLLMSHLPILADALENSSTSSFLDTYPNNAKKHKNYYAHAYVPVPSAELFASTETSKELEKVEESTVSIGPFKIRNTK